jgi:hypothetical protein
MSDQEIVDWFFDAVEGLPPEMAEAAREWFAKREAAFQLLSKMQEKGVSALLPG